MYSMETEVNYPYEILDALVRRIFFVDDVTIGSAKQNYIVRYRGHLLSEDTVAAYDQLAASMKSMNITVLFRWDEERHAVLLVPALPKPKDSNPWINLVLFVITLLSVIFTGAFFGSSEPLPSDPVNLVLAVLQRGWPFAVSLLAILGTHEFSHYLAGRWHGVKVSLPYFIPMPFSSFGTMGAFINMKEPPKNKRVLLDIGLAGPLAGLIVAIPILFIGLKLSTLDKIPMVAPVGTMFQIEGNSLLYLAAKWLVFGKLLPAPVSFQGLPPLIYWLVNFFTGRPYPLGGLDVMLHPVAWAGWAGILVTGLNLIPAGQLDGGHVLYTLLGRKIALRLRPVILIVLLLLGLVWNGWWLWAALIFFFGRFYAEPLDQITTLDGKRRALAVLGLVVLLLVFIPVPLTIIG
jgi:membrane-associated protease RseP (regulator of RpoE activity)